MTTRELEHFGIVVMLATFEKLLSLYDGGGNIFWDEGFLPDHDLLVQVEERENQCFWIANRSESVCNSPPEYVPNNFNIIRLETCFRNSRAIQNFVACFTLSDSLKKSACKESDLPVVILHTNSRDQALKHALENYVNDFVMYVKAFSGKRVYTKTPRNQKKSRERRMQTEISQLIESCHGWNVMRWQELYDSESDSIKPNTIFLARDLGSTVGIEVKNVIVDLSPVRPKVHTVRIKDWDKFNLVKLATGGKVLGSS